MRLMKNKKDIDNDIFSELKKSFQEIIIYGKGKCCVCRHDLALHVDEDQIWRCHALGADGFQCECALRKKGVENIVYYDLSARAKEQLDELEKEIDIDTNNTDHKIDH